jgi:hypothetical protein
LSIGRERGVWLRVFFEQLHGWCGYCKSDQDMGAEHLAWIGLVLILAPLLVRWLSARALRRSTLEWHPEELRAARLVYAEKTFRADGQPRIIARLDRAYRVADHLVLVELKNRSIHRTYLSDVIELSAQKLAVEIATGQSVSDTRPAMAQSACGSSHERGADSAAD